MNGNGTMFKQAAGIAAAFAISAMSLSAQQPGQQPQPRMPAHHPQHMTRACPLQQPGAINDGNGMPGSPSAAMMMPGPAMMMTQRTELGLSNAQVTRLDTLAALQQRSMQRFMPQITRAMADLKAATTGDIDVDAARAAHNRFAATHADMLVANLTAIKNARQVLTPEQRTRWDAMVAQCGGVIGMMMRGMMMHHKMDMQNRQP